jgi:predicted dehydrogenase
MPDLRFGILGTGNIARQFAQGVAGSARSTCVAVGSRRQQTADAFAENHSLPAAYSSYDELLADKDVDAVYISLPNSEHHRWTLAALNAGKHVLCEKPLAVSTNEAAEMFDTADRCGKLLVEAFMHRSHPLTHAYMQAIRDGQIGTVKLVRASFCYAVGSTENNIRFDADLAGGAIMDIGCYCLDFARMVVGEDPTALHGVGHVHDTGVDDYAAATLRFPGGAVATLTCGMTVQATNAALVGGDQGHLTVPIPWKPPTQNATFILDGQIKPKQDTTAPQRQRQEITVDAHGPLYGMEADDFAAAVQDGAEPRVTRADSMGNMKWLAAWRDQVVAG